MGAVPGESIEVPDGLAFLGLGYICVKLGSFGEASCLEDGACQCF